jgi:hypothetical protein
VIEALDRVGIPFTVTGSVAGVACGAARSTIALDLVIDPAPGQVERFVATLHPEESYVSLDAASRPGRSRMRPG